MFWDKVWLSVIFSFKRLTTWETTIWSNCDTSKNDKFSALLCFDDVMVYCPCRDFGFMNLIFHQIFPLKVGLISNRSPVGKVLFLQHYRNLRTLLIIRMTIQLCVTWHNMHLAKVYKRFFHHTSLSPCHLCWVCDYLHHLINLEPS